MVMKKAQVLPKDKVDADISLNKSNLSIWNFRNSKQSQNKSKLNSKKY
jgi:hypothetical protein